jgi:Flp pilus assembly protein TadD
MLSILHTEIVQHPCHCDCQNLQDRPPIAANMTIMTHDHSLLLALGWCALAIWPFRREGRDEPEQEDTASVDGEAADPVIDHMDWGIRLGMLGRFERAIERFEQAVQIAPDEPSAHYNLALTHDLAGDHARARDAYARAIEIDPTFRDSHTNLGVTCTDLGDDDKAIESLRRASELDPSDAIPYYDTGCVLLAEGKCEEAAAEFRKAVGADPKDAQTRFNLAVTLRRAGKAHEAGQEFRDFLALARGRYPEQRSYTTKLLESDYGERGG